ncbi:MAG: SPOR domain-containing protein [Cocleimonas sp.]|nr:SPOR domain-containing protein [Cocleimonas sp.]
MPVTPPNFPLRHYQKGASNLVIGLLVAAVAFLGLYHLKSRGIISVPTTISDTASSINQTINPFSDDHSGYGVQITASHYLDDAKGVMQTFADAGYSSFVVSSNIRGSTMYQVRLGPYSHKAEAKAIKDKVRRRFPNNRNVRKSFIVYRD